MERVPRGIIWLQRTQRRAWLAKVKPTTPRIHAGCTARRASMWAKEIPRKVYQRKKALMSRPGMVFSRLRLLVAVALMQAPGPERKDGPRLRRREVGTNDDEACRFDCIVSMVVWKEVWRMRVAAGMAVSRAQGTCSRSRGFRRLKFAGIVAEGCERQCRNCAVECRNYFAAGAKGIWLHY